MDISLIKTRKPLSLFPLRTDEKGRNELPLWSNIDNQEDLPLIYAEVNIIFPSILQSRENQGIIYKYK
jgi:hypothetical protein